MTKLLMVSSNVMDDPYPVYPLGANIVASAVKKSGIEVKFFDLMVDGIAGLDTALVEFKPDYIAISMRNVDNVNFNEPQSFVFQYKSLIEKIQQTTKAPIILGGAAYTIFPSQFLEFLGADYGIIGPGEVSLPKLLAMLEQKKLPPNPIIIGEIDNSGENGYYLARESRLTQFYLHQGGMLNISTKRGCPHQCLYCSYPQLEGTRYIFRQPEAVVDEIAFLKNKYQADFLFFTDSVFNDCNNQYLLIMEEMARRGITIPWTAYLRPAEFQREEIELMKRTGLHSVEWGTDCSSDPTLRGMKKSFCWDDVRKANNLFAEYDIPGSHFIIFGGPGETSQTVREGIKNLSELDYCVVFGGMGVRVFPGTGICELAKQTGLIRDESELFAQEIYYHSPDIDVEWLNQYLMASFKQKRNWIFPWAGVAERNRFMHNSGFRGSLWDLLLKRKS
ncbi:MAG TPA: B12-binding domain-containing radical SAM protein [Firmicutes bacterium]|jgi:radical SAM superfamily enzyme YgiQ (UPF0313 family)|nr:B12-binding domain-containing radical SAM protein [Bacillota bacterium]